MNNVTLKYALSKKLAQRTTPPNSLRCVFAAEHHTAEQYSKTARTKPRKHPQEAIYHGIRARQDFLKIPSL